MSMSKEMDDWMAKQGVVSAPAHLPRKQGLIHAVARMNGGRVTLAQAVDVAGKDIYCNAGKHVGSILSRMVKNGTLNRIKPGLFSLRNSQP